MDMTAPALVNYTVRPDGETAVMDIDGYIGRDVLHEWMTGEKSENTVKNIKSALREIQTPKIIVNINSPGGYWNDGLVIMNMLQQKNAEIITNLMGFTSSVGILLSQAGNIRRMPFTSFLLLHRVALPACGYLNQNSLRELLKECQTLDEQIIKMYERKSHMKASEVGNLMDAGGGYGKWISAEDALKHGLIDEIYNPADEGDVNTDHLEGEEKENRMRNIQMLNSKASFSTKSERNKEIRRLQKSAPEPIKNKPESRRNASVNTSPEPTAIQIAETCFHEAGHVIMATCFGRDVECIEIEKKDNRSGYYSLGNNCELQPWQSMAISIAGPMAEYAWRNGDSSIMDFKINQISVRDGVASDDGFQIQLTTESLSVNQREWTRQKALKYSHSRLIRNWHHVTALAEYLKECRTMGANDYKEWFNKATRYDEFYY